MAKEFKNWDKMFSRQEIFECRVQWLRNGASQTDILAYNRWPREVSQWPQEFVQACVYVVSDAREWQCFRVSMKGLTTQEKLYMLDNRYVARVLSNSSDDPTGIQWSRYKIEKCRIDNYIGALRRGNQLNAAYEVVS